jgi:chromosome segregation and condensation protein ScpB
MVLVKAFRETDGFTKPHNARLGLAFLLAGSGISQRVMIRILGEKQKRMRVMERIQK